MYGHITVQFPLAQLQKTASELMPLTLSAIKLMLSLMPRSVSRFPVSHLKQFLSDEMRYKRDVYLFICLLEVRKIQLFIVKFTTIIGFLMCDG